MSVTVAVYVKQLFGVEFMPIPMRTPAEATIFVRVNDSEMQEVTFKGLWGSANECPDDRWHKKIVFQNIYDIGLIHADMLCNGLCHYSIVGVLSHDD